ncbi:F0F1 ATP synthase subunit delta [Occultella kanbiaonis]|uniref:F0F1 ATP synthase subunit delta n=1 Tax=Occultella kanbiaonis TaxID=2675754 RepID=UPI0012B80C11|nr:F0F1 ATP synthase subunit delta [Occultella kanbiaonis]
MRASSQGSLAAATDRWEAVLGTAGADSFRYGTELFGVVDVLDGSAALRRALTDPSRSGEDKAAVVAGVFGPKVSGAVADLLAGLVRSRWSAEGDLADSIEQLGTTSLLAGAESRGELIRVEDELFRTIRLLADNRELRLALADKDRTVADRQRLLTSLFGARVAPETAALLERALSTHRAPTLTAALVRLNEAAAARRQQLVAVVTAARPLTQVQVARLGEILARAYGRAVQVNVALDPAVVGGLRIQLGDEVIDATMLSRLDEAQRRLAG